MNDKNQEYSEIICLIGALALDYGSNIQKVISIVGTSDGNSSKELSMMRMQNIPEKIIQEITEITQKIRGKRLGGLN